MTPAADAAAEAEAVPGFDPALDLVLTRDIAAPRSVLWRCWSEPEQLMQWFVPRPHRVTACRLELQTGGAFDTTFDVDGAVVENRGVILEVIPQEKLVFSDSYSAGWKPAPDPFMTAVITLQDLGPGLTRYRALVRHRSKDAAETHLQMGFHDGWGAAAAQLAERAAELAQALTLTISRFIAAPPATVWRCWSDPEILPRWFGPEGYSCRTREIDLRQGGQWRFDMLGPDGRVWPNRHRITLYRAPERIEYLLDDDGAGPAMQVTVTLQPEAQGTRLTQTMLFPDAATLAGARAFGAERLGQTTLDKLARLAEAA